MSWFQLKVKKLNNPKKLFHLLISKLAQDLDADVNIDEQIFVDEEPPLLIMGAPEDLEDLPFVVAPVPDSPPDLIEIISPEGEEIGFVPAIKKVHRKRQRCFPVVKKNQ